MPFIRVRLENGHEWLVSPWEITIPHDATAGMDATAIGETFTGLLGVLKAFAPYANAGKSFDSLEAFAAFLEAEARDTRAAVARALAVKDARREIVSEYDAIFQYLRRRDGFHCQHCSTAVDLTIDHKYPVSRGGTNDLDNLQLLCKPCNSTKGARIDEGVAPPGGMS